MFFFLQEGRKKGREVYFPRVMPFDYFPHCLKKKKNESKATDGRIKAITKSFSNQFKKIVTNFMALVVHITSLQFDQTVIMNYLKREILYITVKLEVKKSFDSQRYDEVSSIIIKKK